jgi:integrase
MLRVLRDAGLRRGELVGLIVSDIDLDARVLTVARSTMRKGTSWPLGGYH